MNTDIVEYQPIEAGLATLRQQYQGVVYDVTTEDGMKLAKADRNAVRKYRTDLDKIRVKLNEASLAHQRKVNAEAKRITAEISAIEDPIARQITAEEDKERERIEQMKRDTIDRENARIAAEKAAEEARMAAERAEIDRQKAAIAEAAKLARMQIEAEERAARQAREDADRAARLEREAADRAARELREAEEARLKVERDKLEAARREQEAKERAEREAAEKKERAKREADEAKKREVARKAAEKADARGMLELFVKRYGALPEFETMARLIEEFLRGVK